MPECLKSGNESVAGPEEKRCRSRKCLGTWDGNRHCGLYSVAGGAEKSGPGTPRPMTGDGPFGGPGTERPRTWDGCFGVWWIGIAVILSGAKNLANWAGCHSCAGVGMEQAPRVRGCSSLGSQKRGSPGRLTADASLLATPSARLTVVERTPSCPCHVRKARAKARSSRTRHSHRSLHRPSRGSFFVKVASEHPLPPSPPAPCLFFFSPQCERGQRATPA